MPSPYVLLALAVLAVFLGLVLLLVWAYEGEYADELRERERPGG
jgi:hypothetical protein